ncbi:MAG: MaoC family dehydratase [Micromonosporaceae bacterium]
MRVFSDLDEFAAASGEHLGHSDWHVVTQAQVDQFADATGDHQWIHVDRERAAEGPFGAPIAHGYLTLSLLPMLGWQVYRVDGIAMGVNYGLDKVRFPAVVPVGSRVRAGVQLREVSDVPGGKQAVIRFTVEMAGGEKPACVADTVARFLA